MATETRLVHVRFAPNGTVTEIGERPAPITVQEWFHVLSRRAGTAYQPLSGGRGLFRLTPSLLQDLQAQAVSAAT